MPYFWGMLLESKIISFKGMPLFQRARFRYSATMQGALEEFACFFYITEGNMVTYDSRGRHHLGEREAVVKNCNRYVQRYQPNEGAEECEAIAVYLYPELLRTIYQSEVPSFMQWPTVPAPKKYIGNQLIEQYMTNLALYFEAPEAFDEELGVLKLKELMLILLKSENHQSLREMLSEIFTPVQVGFRQAIEHNLYNVLSMEELAYLCHMSLSTFKREFKRVFGASPARYIKQRRLEQAAKLLVTSTEPVSAIGYDVGFQDATTFSASFHAQYGESPSQYRQSQTRKS